tara:strand:+ start:479 stop:1138 length:660 start_codon:yes stop_codon:yes gene_type:complete
MMPEIQSGSVDVIVSDPPYGISYVSHTRVATPLFASMADDNNLAWIPEFLTESYRVLKNPGAIVLFTRWDVYSDWEKYVEAAKFMIKQVWHWDKGDSGSTGDLDGTLSPCIEWMIYATKGRYRMYSKRRSDIFRYPKTPPAKRWHPIQKPEALLQDVINVLCEGFKDPIVLDPYSGSGSTLMAAKKLGIKSAGYELAPDDKQQYADMMKKKFSQSVMLL